MGFIGVLFTVFLVLKLINVIKWSWLWVLSPIWISVVIIGIVSFIAALTKKK